MFKNIKKYMIAQSTSLVDPFETPDTPEGLVRFVCISDTHAFTDNLEIPKGDVLIHAGDFTRIGLPDEVRKFNTFLKNLPHKYKVVIAGNHDITFDKEKCSTVINDTSTNITIDQLEQLRNSLEDVIYLENSSTNIYGYEIYGSPYSSIFLNWAFMKDEEGLSKIWKSIPDTTDILITHGPPKFIGDITSDDINAGSQSLLEEVQKRIKPKYHIFGHIHEGYGIYTDNTTTFINCSIMDENYDPTNEPIVFDLPIKANKINK